MFTLDTPGRVNRKTELFSKYGTDLARNHVYLVGSKQPVPTFFNSVNRVLEPVIEEKAAPVEFKETSTVHVKKVKTHENSRLMNEIKVPLSKGLGP